MHAPYSPPPPLSVLVVDDDAGAATALTTRLLDDGFRAECCHDTETALRRLSKGCLQAVITDLEIPRCGGLQLLRDGKPWLEGVAVFVVSSSVLPRRGEELAELGVVRAFTKPLDYGALLASLHASAAQRSTRSQTRP